MTRPRTLAFAATLAALVALPAVAQERGSWAVAIGAHTVNPNSDNGALAGGTLPLDIGSDTRPTITAEYFVRDNLGLEVLAAVPFEHDLSIEGLGRIGSTRHLPPTLTLQYHFNSAGRVSPFLGAGLNYTAFFKESTDGALAGSELTLDDSWGAAAHAGIDFAVGERGAFRVDVRWIDIDTDVQLDGASLGTAHIDPLVFGVAWRFDFAGRG